MMRISSDGKVVLLTMTFIFGFVIIAGVCQDYMSAQEPHSIQEKAKRLTDGKEVSEPITPQMLLSRIKGLEARVERLESERRSKVEAEEIPSPDADFEKSSIGG